MRNVRFTSMYKRIGLVLVAGLLIPVSTQAVLAGCGPPATKTPGIVTFSLSVTGAGQALSRITSDPVDETFPSISPDGQVLLFNALVFRNVYQYGRFDRILDQATIVGVDPNSGARRTMYTPTNSLSLTPTWLPSNKAFVYASNAPGSRSLVRSLSAAPNAAVTVVASGQVVPMIFRPSVGPDSNKVAFQTQLRGVWNIGVIGLDGSRLTLIGEGEEPSWSPDGTRLVFQRTVNGFSQIFMVNPETGSDLVQITSGDDNNDYPAWSPDGKLIVFSSSRGWNTLKGGSLGATRNLYFCKPDGTGVTQLTSGSGKCLQPSWGRDGWIYFSSNQAGNYDIWRLKPIIEGAEGGSGTPAPPTQ